MEIWLVILFLSRKKFNAKQICVLSSTMKLGPGLKIISGPKATGLGPADKCNIPALNARH